MEKLEFQKSLEKKRAYIKCYMILLGLLMPTLISVFKKINLALPLQITVTASILLLLAFFHLKSVHLKSELVKIRKFRN